MKPELNPTIILQQCLSRLASLHDLPEILQARITEDGKITKAQISVTPRGQMSLIVRKLEFSASLNVFDSKNLFRLRVTLSYDHVTGGSNGKSVDYLGTFELRYGGSSVEVSSLVIDEEFHRLYREMTKVDKENEV